MGHPNEDWARRWFREVVAGDTQGFWDAHHGDVVFRMGGRNRFSGEFVGKQAALRMFASFRREFPNFREDMRDVLANDQRIVTLWSGRVERDGRVFEGTGTAVLELRDNKIAHVWETFDDVYSWDEFVNSFHPLDDE